MKNLSLTVAFGLASLLGGGLLLPAAASAHEADGNKRMQRDHHAPQQQGPSLHGGNWYLQRHREAGHHGYYPQPHPYRMHHKGQQHHHGKYLVHHRAPHQEQHPSPQHRVYAPVSLKIGYEIIL
jgi:hypothetical protein